MSEPLWTPDALADAIGGRPVGPEPPPITGISIDSASLSQGDGFFAVNRNGRDGHDLVGAAMAKGASLAVVAQERLAALGRVTGSLIVVDDVTEALGRLAVAARARYRGKVITIIGAGAEANAIGEMLRRALGRSGPVHGPAETIGGEWGLMPTLVRMPEYAPFSVFEIGSVPWDDLASLTAVIRPHVAIVAQIEGDPAEAIAEENGEARSEVFAGVVAGGTAILNRDSPDFELLFRQALQAGVQRIISFGHHQDADACADEVSGSQSESAVRADIGGRAMSYAIGAPGDDLVMSSLAMLAAVQSVGGDLDAAGASLSGFTRNSDAGDGESDAPDARGV